MANNICVLLLFCLAIVIGGSKAEIPAVFVFGDSTADVGTNDYLPTSNARADFPPNGIDFPNSIPTGRFSNGLNSADFLAILMGFEKSPPPFLAPSNFTTSLRGFKGLSFASGGSGLLKLTGSRSMARLLKLEKKTSPLDRPPSKPKNVITLGEQIDQFGSVCRYLVTTMGRKAAQKFISKSMFFISSGSNDLFGYYHSKSSVSESRFMSLLGSTYHNHLKNLIDLGARKFGIVSVAPIGCCPSQRAFNASGGCVEDLNEYARTFHSNLAGVLQKLSKECDDMKYSLGNAFEMTINVINNPLPFNFTEVKTACCGAGDFNGEARCDGNASVCADRRGHLFWDWFHPTEAASQLAAITLYGGDQRFVTPINFSELASL